MSTAFVLLGGIGIFLLGLVLLTDGAKDFVGDSLRRVLIRFTGTPYKAFLFGVLATIVLQSSSATTMTLIGFVSAGLLPFQHAVGVVFGASLGSTSTGWLVSSLGLKVSLGSYALPMVGVGTFLRILGRNRWRALGLAMAGFGLIFIGITTLQEGMQGFAASFDLGSIPVDGMGGRLMAFGIGFLLTVLMQSSGAAVATVMTALHLEAIQFEQAAVLVIGAAVGTTAKGALVAIGATVSAKRTALAHILFNTATGAVALVLLPLFMCALKVLQAKFGMTPGAQGLALFHTIFIAVGVLVFLPFSQSFANAVEWMLPARGPRLTMHLDTSLLSLPAIALEAVRRALCETTREAVSALLDVLQSNGRNGGNAQYQQLTEAFDEIQLFLARIPSPPTNSSLAAIHLAQIHGMDHLMRLLSRLQPSDGIRGMLTHDRLAPSTVMLKSLLQSALVALSLEEGQESRSVVEQVRGLAEELAKLRRDERAELLQETAAGDWVASDALEALDACRWMDGIGYHAWRLCHYLASSDMPGGAPTSAGEMRQVD